MAIATIMPALQPIFGIPLSLFSSIQRLELLNLVLPPSFYVALSPPMSSYRMC